MMKVGPLAEVTPKSQLPEVMASCAPGVGVGVGVGAGVLDPPPPHPVNAQMRRTIAIEWTERTRAVSLNEVSAEQGEGI